MYGHSKKVQPGLLGIFIIRRTGIYKDLGNFEKVRAYISTYMPVPHCTILCYCFQLLVQFLFSWKTRVLRLDLDFAFRCGFASFMETLIGQFCVASVVQ